MRLYRIFAVLICLLTLTACVDEKQTVHETKMSESAESIDEKERIALYERFLNNEDKVRIDCNGDFRKYFPFEKEDYLELTLSEIVKAIHDSCNDADEFYVTIRKFEYAYLNCGGIDEKRLALRMDLKGAEEYTVYLLIGENSGHLRMIYTDNNYNDQQNSSALDVAVRYDYIFTEYKNEKRFFISDFNTDAESPMYETAHKLKGRCQIWSGELDDYGEWLECRSTIWKTMRLKEFANRKKTVWTEAVWTELDYNMFYPEAETELIDYTQLVDEDGLISYLYDKRIEEIRNGIEDPEAFLDNNFCNFALWHAMDAMNKGTGVNLGYLQEDIDGDGIDELLICDCDSEGNVSDGAITDMYTIRDHNLYNITDICGYRNFYLLCENGIIREDYGYPNCEYGTKYYHYENGDLKLIDGVYETPNYEEGDSDYFYENYLQKDNARKLTEGEFDKISDELDLKYKNQKLKVHLLKER